MSSENTVKGVPLTFGTAGTSTLVLSSATNTSSPYALPRGPYSVQVTQRSTGTSIAAATVIWQASNDNLAYAAIGSATTLPATNAGTGTGATFQAAGVTFSGTPYAFGRAILGSTGTGDATVWLGS